MLRPEQYDGEHQDLREEYSREEYNTEIDELRREAGCTNECDLDCSCVENLIEERQERQDQEMDYWASRGIP